MRVVKGWIAIALVCISTGAFALGATFDAGTGVLFLPAVKVGSATFTNVQLGLINPANFTFRLQTATQQLPAGPADIVFDVSTGTVSIPSVTVGTSTFINVKLQITDSANLTFILTAATLQQPGGGNASVCLDPASYATGARWDLNYQLTNGAQIRTMRTEIEVNGPESFNGQNAIEIKSTIFYLTGAGAGTTAVNWSYSQVQNLDVLTTGSKTNNPLVQGFTSTSTTTFNPPPIFRYSLNSGESVTTNYTATQVTVIAGLPVPPTTSIHSGSRTWTFLGFEDVTVPAGIFIGACKWASTIVTDGIPDNSTLWITRKGVSVKTVSGNDVTELTSGNVNGGPVGP